jgi:hypothetical protein
MAKLEKQAKHPNTLRPVSDTISVYQHVSLYQHSMTARDAKNAVREWQKCRLSAERLGSTRKEQIAN